MEALTPYSSLMDNDRAAAKVWTACNRLYASELLGSMSCKSEAFGLRHLGDALNMSPLEFDDMTEAMPGVAV